jgi:hypothetical protein
LGIVWIAAHSPHAKGRVERSFQTAQDRLVKGLRVAGVRTLEEANRYLEEEFVAWWNQHLMVVPANAADAHRALGATHDLSGSLCHVDSREVDNDYTIRLDGKRYRIVSDAMPTGLRSLPQEHAGLPEEAVTAHVAGGGRSLAHAGRARLIAKFHKERRAKAARRSSDLRAFYIRRPLLGDFTKADLS